MTTSRQSISSHRAFPARFLTFGIIPDHQQSVPTHHLPRGRVHKHQGWDTGHLVLVPQLHLHGEKHTRRREVSERRGGLNCSHLFKFQRRGGRRLNCAKFIQFFFFLRLELSHLKYDKNKKKEGKKKKSESRIYIYFIGITLALLFQRGSRDMEAG